MSWGALILALLQMVTSLLRWSSERKLLQAGQDQAIAQASLKVLEATEAGKALREHIRSMSDEEADKLWEDMLKHGN